MCDELDALGIGPLQAVTIRQIAANLFHHAAKPPSEDSRQKAGRLA